MSQIRVGVGGLGHHADPPPKSCAFPVRVSCRLGSSELEWWRLGIWGQAKRLAAAGSMQAVTFHVIENRLILFGALLPCLHCLGLVDLGSASSMLFFVLSSRVCDMSLTVSPPQVLL